MTKVKLMTHIVGGYPDFRTSEELVVMMEKSGADFVEIQIPFSDPMADGPVLMEANQKALEGGARVKDSFILMKKLSGRVKIPLLFMGYFNTVFNYGVERFCRDAKRAGVWGLIIPDIGIDEGGDFLKACKKNQLHNVFVIAPNTPGERLKLIGKHASGLVYCMARKGVTGKKTDFDAGLDSYLKRVRKFICVPLAVGFGISERKQVLSLGGKAEVAVIGTALMKELMRAKSRDGGIKNVEEFLKRLQ